MSDIVINESVSMKRKWKELVSYKIFMMKLVEFGISFALMILPYMMKEPKGQLYCISAAPTLVISLLLLVSYVFDQAPYFMEKMYLILQSIFTFGAVIQCLLLNFSNFIVCLVYAILYALLLAALMFDLYLNIRERGCNVVAA